MVVAYRIGVDELYLDIPGGRAARGGRDLSRIYPAEGARGMTAAVFTSVFTCPLISTLMTLVHSLGGMPINCPVIVVVVNP